MKNTLLIFLVLAVVIFIVYKKRVKTREEKIDYLSRILGYNPAWVKMNTEELNTVYEYARLSEQGLKDTIPADLKIRLDSITAKYK